MPYINHIKLSALHADFDCPLLKTYVSKRSQGSNRLGLLEVRRVPSRDPVVSGIESGRSVIVAFLSLHVGPRKCSYNVWPRRCVFIL